jgi:hypothetical protein
VNGAAAALTAKVVLARLKEDKSKLTSTYAKAKSIKTAGYTPYSVATLNAALNYAETIIDAPEGSYTQAQVDAADKGIDKAVKSLVWLGTSQGSGAAPDEAATDCAADNNTAADDVSDNTAADKASGKAPSDKASGADAAAAGGADSPAAGGGVIVADGQAAAAAAGAAGGVDIAAADTPLTAGDGSLSVINVGAASSEDGAAGSVPTAVYVLIALLACALAGCLIVMIKRRKGQAE